VHAPIVELGSGMNVWNAQRQVFEPAEPAFSYSETEDAFMADRVQAKVRLSAEINLEGAVTLLTPEGQIIRVTPRAIALYNRRTGQFGVIGVLTNSTGVPNPSDVEEEEYPTWTHIIDIVHPSWAPD